MGFRVGVVTSWGSEFPLGDLRQIPISNLPVEHSTTFENIYTAEGRIQKIHHQASTLDTYLIPDPWKSAPIVHLAPIAQEVEPSLVRLFPQSAIYLTLQGWLRNWDNDGYVHEAEWPEGSFVLANADAGVISSEDVSRNETRIDELVAPSRLFAITNGPRDTRVYWNGELRTFTPPPFPEIDPTGAGDIFSTVFFIHYYRSGDPWEAALFANILAARSITRVGLNSVPRAEEIDIAALEVL
jgi:sugar/nucleoside kinase (ribokinase family)